MKTVYLKVQVPDDAEIVEVLTQVYTNQFPISWPFTEIHLPTEEDFETAGLNYRDKSDDENTNEDTQMIDVHWYDKQDAYIASAEWLKSKILEQ